MCGLSGIISIEGDVVASSLSRMVETQSHRGPDGKGAWHAQYGQQYIGLGHNRLSIFDLSSAGAQPFISAEGRHVLIYNGELYNFIELRSELRLLGHRFRSDGDTEVVLAALVQWGAEVALSKFNGMWAFAWVDLSMNQLTLSRDRVGKKPLYYYRNGSTFLFASEIKAILAGSRERFPINLSVVSRYIGQSLLSAQDETFFEGIRSVPAGHNLTLQLTGLPVVPTPDVRAFWSLPSKDDFRGSIEDRIEMIRETFVDSVRRRMRSDVPVGVMLSGGLGSSSIAGAMRAIAGNERPSSHHLRS